MGQPQSEAGRCRQVKIKLKIIPGIFGSCIDVLALNGVQYIIAALDVYGKIEASSQIGRKGVA